MNVYQRIQTYGHDEDFIPTSSPDPTNAAPGTAAKIVALMARVERGEELWHEDDCGDCEGVQPHEIRRGPSQREPAIREILVRHIHIPEDDE